MPELETFSAALPDGRTESRQSSRNLRLAVVVASTAGARADQLEASIAAHRAEALADLRNDGMRHDSRKEARRVSAIRDAEVVADVARLEELRALPADTLVEASVWGWYPTAAAAEKGLAGASTLYPVAEIVPTAVGEIPSDTPGGKVGVVFPTDVMFNSPNAADKPGGTDQGDTMNNVKLTAKETALMAAIADRQFSFFDDGISEGSGIWADCLTGEIVGSAAYPVSETRRGVASVLNSLCRKGLLISEDDEESTDGAWTYLTAAGVAWCEAHTAAKVEELPVVTLSGEMTEAVEVEAPVELVEAPAETIVDAELVAENAARQDAPIVEETTVEVPEAPVKWGMGTHKVGDVVKSKDGLEWTVIGPAEKGKTVRLERTVDGAVKVRLSFHYNITKA
ncbi:hypothetical protein SEA_BUMBLE_76 [Arthrobacter phage Bumble]